MMEYYKAAEVSDVREGELHPVEVDGEPVCLAKIDNQIFAFTDNCTHISGPLNEGDFEGCMVTCPWHGAQFDVRTGKVLRGPARQDLHTYPVKIEGESIFIGLPPNEE
ncbi:Rieske (2Fe-2S) protein [Ktedonospora formicarum]|uniref:(2Fe-2S)-binding protein n=1 Tax=Ktedonospora formicarum TaxID=2778364 RepID=A0A8J3HWE9_9CHLR|nr:non-heme iron oxygenase ferredoxin subunit [Ktedonospora formicarum]GHO44466.1 (2Fe-2S)-binding protein [Ktedonospora formicarum]